MTAIPRLPISSPRSRQRSEGRLCDGRRALDSGVAGDGAADNGAGTSVVMGPRGSCRPSASGPSARSGLRSGGRGGGLLGSLAYVESTGDACAVRICPRGGNETVCPLALPVPDHAASRPQRSGGVFSISTTGRARSTGYSPRATSPRCRSCMTGCSRFQHGRQVGGRRTHRRDLTTLHASGRVAGIPVPSRIPWTWLTHPPHSVDTSINLKAEDLRQLGRPRRRAARGREQPRTLPAHAVPPRARRPAHSSTTIPTTSERCHAASASWSG